MNFAHAGIEAKAHQQVADLHEKFRMKEASVSRARKKFDKENLYRQRQLETQIQEAKSELSKAKEDAKNKL